MKNIGPGSVIAAAFIGPGTVTMCTIAGSQFGFALLWALLLSIIITIFLQTTAVKIGIISQKSLSSTIVSQFNSKAIRMMSVVLILSAILIGNIAYEAGNISGGVLGLEAMFGELSFSNGFNGYSLIIGLIAFFILLLGNNRILEKILMGLVLFMSLAYLSKFPVNNLKGLFPEYIWNSFGYDYRIVFDWTDPNIEFNVQFVNPKNKYFNWSHTVIDSRDNMIDEIHASW